MDDLLREIEAAIRGNAWVLALTGTLALPDMCAAIESDNGWATKDKYMQWFKRYLGDQYPILDPDECYQLRSSMLHTGSSRGRKYERVIFAAPGPLFLHNNVIEGALNLDLPTFCRDVMAAVHRWETEMKDSQAYQRNLPKVVRWYGDGIPPYIVGIPVLS